MSDRPRPCIITYALARRIIFASYGVPSENIFWVPKKWARGLSIPPLAIKGQCTLWAGVSRIQAIPSLPYPLEKGGYESISPKSCGRWTGKRAFPTNTLSLVISAQESGGIHL